MHHFSNTDWIENDVNQLLRSRRSDIGRKNSTGKLSLRAVFKYLRKQPKYSLLGDYPLISVGARLLKKHQLPITKKAAFSAMDASKELHGRFRGKIDLVKQII